MDEVIAPEVAGVHIRVHDRQGDWSASAGTTMMGGDQLVPTSSWFRIGSITKTALSPDHRTPPRMAAAGITTLTNVEPAYQRW
ncbi:hypothetical protein [Nocardia asteroides]|uniref:hypothetical protein n=1 Tax=Nocardia asteroides TaxID=1824 RepID=UPI003447286A